MRTYSLGAQHLCFLQNKQFVNCSKIVFVQKLENKSWQVEIFANISTLGTPIKTFEFIESAVFSGPCIPDQFRPQ